MASSVDGGPIPDASWEVIHPDQVRLGEFVLLPLLLDKPEVGHGEGVIVNENQHLPVIEGDADDDVGLTSILFLHVRLDDVVGHRLHDRYVFVSPCEGHPGRSRDLDL